MFDIIFSRRNSLVVFLIASLIVTIFWYGPPRPGKTAEEIAIEREHLGISILAVNLFDIMNFPPSPSGLPWKTRYNRIITWMKDTQTFPDIIALQEAPGFWQCLPLDSNRLTDYEAIDHLLDGIREASGEQYRIAYLIARKPHLADGNAWIGDKPAQFCTTQGGHALLYRPNRLFNVINDASDFYSSSDSEDLHNSYIVRSIQCCQPDSSNIKDTCMAIDGQSKKHKDGDLVIFRPICSTPVGVAWTRNQFQPDKSSRDAVFSRFELVTAPGKFIHIYNVHRRWERDDPDNTRPGDVGAENINQLVTDMESKFSSPGDPTLYPPILVGDFNIGDDEPPPSLDLLDAYFPKFEVGMWGPEVMGALFGKGSIFPTQQKAYANLQQIMPKLLEGESCDGNQGSDTSILWSDHCGIFFRIEPSKR